MALEERIRGRSVAAAFEERAAVDPSRTFLIFGDRRYTFGQVERQATALAAGLSELGI